MHDLFGRVFSSNAVIRIVGKSDFHDVALQGFGVIIGFVIIGFDVFGFDNTIFDCI
jgi:hypothetical protein